MGASQFEGSHDNHVTGTQDTSELRNDDEKEDDVFGTVDNDNHSSLAAPPSPHKLLPVNKEMDDTEGGGETVSEVHETHLQNADYIIRCSPSRYSEYTDDQEQQQRKVKFALIVAKLNKLHELLDCTEQEETEEDNESVENPSDLKPGEISEEYIRTTLSTLETEASDIKGTMQRALKKKTNALQNKITCRYSQGVTKDITVGNYESVKRRNTYVVGQPMYTHPGGYKFRVEIWPNGVGMAEGTHVSVDIVSLKGDYDAELKFPVRFSVSLQLLNQYRDQDNYSKCIECEYQEGDYNKEIGSEFEFFLNNDLHWNAETKTQYLLNDVLRFRVTKAVVHEQK